MAKTYGERIAYLEQKLLETSTKLDDVSMNTESTSVRSYGTGGASAQRQLTVIPDIRVGRGAELGSFIVFNDIDLSFPPNNGLKPEGTYAKGYNNHSHSRYSGGAIDINTVEFVEYDVDLDADGNWDNTLFSEHSQAFWSPQDGQGARPIGLDYGPPIKVSQKTTEGQENVMRLGKLCLRFNADSGKWGVAATEIDVKTCMLVEYDKDTGEIALDDNGNKKSASLWNEDETKSSVVWDSNAGVWRFYSVYSDNA